MLADQMVAMNYVHAVRLKPMVELSPYGSLDHHEILAALDAGNGYSDSNDGPPGILLRCSCRRLDCLW